MNSFLSNRAIIIAHGGLSYSPKLAYPKNTVDGILLSLSTPSIKGVEFDICFTKDNKIVVGHEKLTSFCNKTNTQTLIDNIGKFSFEELSKKEFIENSLNVMNVLKSKDIEIVDFYRRLANYTYRIATLKELMVKISKCKEFGNKQIQIEIKNSSMDEKNSKKFGQEILKVCTPYLDKNILFISRDIFILKELIKLNSAVKCGVVIGYEDEYKALEAKECNFGISCAINHSMNIVENSINITEFALSNNLPLAFWNLSNKSQLSQAIKIVQGAEFYAVGDMINLTISK